MIKFRDIIGKKLRAVSFTTSFEGQEDYSQDNRADFDYLPLGGLTMLFEDNSVYCVADYFSTALGTNGVGIERLDGFKLWPNSKNNSEQWNSLIGQGIKNIKLYWNKETWNNGMKNELYPESVELTFNSQTIFYFCGDVDDFNHEENRYNLLAGRDTGIILYTIDSFKKYNLDKVQRVEEITANNG